MEGYSLLAAAAGLTEDADMTVREEHTLHSVEGDPCIQTLSFNLQETRAHNSGSDKGRGCNWYSRGTVVASEIITVRDCTQEREARLKFVQEMVRGRLCT